MKKHVDIWLPAEMHKKIKDMSFKIYKNNPDEHDPMSKALEIVLSRGFEQEKTTCHCPQGSICKFFEIEKESCSYNVRPTKIRK